MPGASSELEGVWRLRPDALRRAFHAGEDLERLRELVRRVLDAAVPPEGPEAAAPPGDLVRVRSFLRRTFAKRPVVVPEPIPEDALDLLLGAPESEIDIARAALLVAREDEPSLDMERSLAKIER